MTYIKPASSKDIHEMRETLELARTVLGIVPNSGRYMVRRKFMLLAFQTFFAGAMGFPNEMSAWQSIKQWLRLGYYGFLARKSGSYAPTEVLFLAAHAASAGFGCRYCEAHTVLGAMNAGVSKEKLAALLDFEKSPVFSDAERAVIEFGLASGKAPTQVTPKIMKELGKHYSDDHVLDIINAVAAYGYLNRFNDILGTPMEAEPIEAATQVLGPKRWNIGKHDKPMPESMPSREENKSRRA